MLEYKEILTQITTDYYSRKLSDKSKVGDYTWDQLKRDAFKKGYKLAEWYKNLNDSDKKLLSNLIEA